MEDLLDNQNIISRCRYEVELIEEDMQHPITGIGALPKMGRVEHLRGEVGAEKPPKRAVTSIIDAALAGC